jgi:DnaJ-class molecular chaperone
MAGKKKKPEKIRCFNCGGRGTVDGAAVHRGNRIERPQVMCPNCGGAGLVYNPNR